MTHNPDRGRFFEDFALGQTLIHATPRTLTPGDTALYTALYGARFALQTSDVFAAACGLPRSPVDDLVAFHAVFGKTVPDISLNAVANLGYAEARFLKPVFPGETLSAVSEVIGLKETSSGKAGIVWVRTLGKNAAGETVLSFCRWVLVRKRDPGHPAPPAVVPDLRPALAPEDLTPPRLDLARYDWVAAGDGRGWGDFSVGEILDHRDGVTVEEAEHMMATRLWHNTARVHFDASLRPDGRRLVYGGHVISVARALSFNGLENAFGIAAINAGTHVNPCFAGTTVTAWSEVLDKAPPGPSGLGALRTRLVACAAGGRPGVLRDAGGSYDPNVLLDLDLWLWMPDRPA